MSRRPRSLLALAALALTALAATGCGSSAEGGNGEAPDYATALAGSPPPLAALHAQGGELLGGGVEAYERRIAALAGYPIVANVWASWCGPCRAEFADLQQLSARYGKRVAFIGVDSQDDDDAAATFLRDNPVPYPSYVDADEEIADSLGLRRGLPNTAFYDRAGELCYLRQGQYPDEATLEADIRRFALRGECESG